MFPFEDPSVKYAEDNFDISPNKSFIIKHRDRTQSIGRPPLGNSVEKRKNSRVRKREDSQNPKLSRTIDQAQLKEDLKSEKLVNIVQS
jgi:hypothetical protein